MLSSKLVCYVINVYFPIHKFAAPPAASGAYAPSLRQVLHGRHRHCRSTCPTLASTPQKLAPPRTPTQSPGSPTSPPHLATLDVLASSPPLGGAHAVSVVVEVIIVVVEIILVIIEETNALLIEECVLQSRKSQQPALGGRPQQSYSYRRWGAPITIGVSAYT